MHLPSFSISRFALLILVLGVLLMTATVLVGHLVDNDRIKERLELELGDALNMDVKIGQPLQFGLLRGISLTLEDIQVSKEEHIVATAENISLRFDMFRLLTGEVRLLDLEITGPVLEIERSSSGELNVYQQDQELQTGAMNELSLRLLRISNLQLNYHDLVSGQQWLLEQCDLELRDLRHEGGAVEQVLVALSAEGQLFCRSLGQVQTFASDLSVDINFDDGVFELDPVSMVVLGGNVSGYVRIDLDFSQGDTWQSLRETAMGSFSLRAENLTLGGFDLDAELENYDATQRFSLLDAGAVFLAGPIGLIATRGYAFNDLLQGSEGSTVIDQMVSDWTIQNGVAEARDVAFRTPENRLALTGALDFTNYQYVDITVAVIDRDACVLVEQGISGPFQAPRIEQPDFLTTAMRPILDLVERGIQVIEDNDCEIFYTGSISHP